MAACRAVADLPPFFQIFSPVCQGHLGFSAHPTMPIQSLPAQVICKYMSKLSGTVKPVLMGDYPLGKRKRLYLIGNQLQKLLKIRRVGVGNPKG